MFDSKTVEGLDADFEKLLGFLREDNPEETVVQYALDFLKGYENSKLGYEEGKLLRHNWEQTWKRDKEIHGGWFYYCTKDAAGNAVPDLSGDKRIEVFRCLMRLVFDDPLGVLANHHIDNLKTALAIYLDSRGRPFNATTPRLSPKFTRANLALLPGAFIYRGHREDLKGKPLHVLEELDKAQEKTLTLKALQDKIWTDSNAGEDAIRSAVAAARKALRKAMMAVGMTEPDDPLPNVDRGTGLTAWRLTLP